VIQPNRVKCRTHISHVLLVQLLLFRIPASLIVGLAPLLVRRALTDSLLPLLLPLLLLSLLLDLLMQLTHLLTHVVIGEWDQILVSPQLLLPLLLLRLDLGLDLLVGDIDRLGCTALLPQ
jgi:hypothetical protein